MQVPDHAGARVQVQGYYTNRLPLSLSSYICTVDLYLYLYCTSY
jgi:hypothetical protein